MTGTVNAWTIPDFHSHILPCMDDGSKSPEMTRLMLDEMSAQGMERVIATPHFYPTKCGIGRFCEKRERAVELFLSVYDREIHPKVHIGAEVAYCRGISQSEDLSELCIKGTRYLLLEMPYARWTDDILDEVFSIPEEQNLQVVLAHVERYLHLQQHHTLEYLIDNRMIIQCNAEYFVEKSTSKKAMKMLDRGKIHLLGSDSHNLSDRRPNLGDAVTEISLHGLSECLKKIGNFANQILSAADTL